MSEFWKEAVSSVAENIKQKRKSPFYGAFVFSWIAFNWKPLSIFLLSERDIYYRINDVQKYASYMDQLVLPTVSALILIFLVPSFHALYKFFDVHIEVLHDAGDSLKETKVNTLKARNEESKVLFNMSSDVFSAEQDRKIEESLKAAAEAKLETSIIESNFETFNEAISTLAMMENEKSSLIEKVNQLNEALIIKEKETIEYRDELARLKKDIEEMKLDSTYRAEIMSSAENKSFAVKGDLNTLLSYKIPETGKQIIEHLDYDHEQLRKRIYHLLSTFASHPSQDIQS